MGGRRQPGFTLLELMLVMAVLVAVTALAVPMLSSPLANYRLRLGADQVRASWVRARATAMEKGRTYVFRFAPGADRFTIEPWISADDYLESDQLVSLGVEADGDSLALSAVQAVKQEILPEGVVLVGSEATADVRAQVLAATTPDPSVAQMATTPLFFYPDGTTSTARVVIANQRGRQVTVSLRGLTGVAQVSGLQPLGASGL